MANPGLFYLGLTHYLTMEEGFRKMDPIFYNGRVTPY